MGPAETSTVRTSVGASESFDTVEAAAEAADRARAGLEPTCDLAVVFASGHHLAMAKWLLSEVHERLEPRALIGCGAGGTVAGGHELEETPGIVVWAASLPGAELETMHLTAERDAQGFRLLGLPESLLEPANADEAGGDESLIALCDPFSFPAEELLAALERSRPHVPVLGGLASASFAGGAVLLRDGEVHTDGAVAVRLRGVQVLPCVSQGAGPVGPEMTITSAEANVIGRAGRQARDGAAWGGDLGPARARARAGCRGGPDRARDRREPARVRARATSWSGRSSAPIGSRARSRSASRCGSARRCACRCATRASADEDLREALRAQAQALGSHGAAGALLFTCNGRGSHMFEVPDHDAAAIEDSLGAPTAGFFCAGEIGPVGGRNFLHGFTATMAVFPA